MTGRYGNTMRTVLVVSPHFPPINAPDMQRVRMSLPHVQSFGWRPVVLAVEPGAVEGVRESLLVDSLPPDLMVRRTRALPVEWARKVGIGNLALRALPFLLAAGTQLLRSRRIDLVYFSTTLFPAMVLGRVWKRRLGVPFVLDIQDPWVNDYLERRPGLERPPKYRLAQAMHRLLEPWTMKAVGGLLAVSTDYLDALVARYPWLAGRPRRTLPFGASEADFDLARRQPPRRALARFGDGELQGVYVGRGGQDMRRALEVVFAALQIGLDERPRSFRRVRLHFVGTDYAARERGRKTVEPVARELGLGHRVSEQPERIPYFEALRLLLEADFLIVPGSDDPRYAASKIYPYVLARKPLLAVFHERSSVVSLLERTRAGLVIPFASADGTPALARRCFEEWSKILESLPFEPPTDWDAFAPYTAREMTRSQCELFDEVLATA